MSQWKRNVKHSFFKIRLFMTFPKPGEGLSPRNGRQCQPLLPRASPVPHAALLAAILATDSAAGPVTHSSSRSFYGCLASSRRSCSNARSPERGPRQQLGDTPPHPILQFCSLNHIELYVDLPEHLFGIFFCFCLSPSIVIIVSPMPGT